MIDTICFVWLETKYLCEIQNIDFAIADGPITW